MRKLFISFSVFALFLLSGDVLSAAVSTRTGLRSVASTVSHSGTGSDTQTGSGVAPRSASLTTPSLGGGPTPQGVQLKNDPLFAKTLKMIVGLGITLFLIYGAAHLIKKISGQRFAGLKLDTTQIRILSTANLPNKQKLFVIEVGGERFLIGAGEGTISLISKLEVGRDFAETLEQSSRNIGATS